MDQKIPLVYSCSGCSSAAQMANALALRLDRKGVAEMSCIAGIGGGVRPLVEKAKSTHSIIGIDGCALRCVEHCLKKEGLSCTRHYVLSQWGVTKKLHEDFDEREARKIEMKILADLDSRIGKEVL